MHEKAKECILVGAFLNLGNKLLSFASFLVFQTESFVLKRRKKFVKMNVNKVLLPHDVVPRQFDLKKSLKIERFLSSTKPLQFDE